MLIRDSRVAGTLFTSCIHISIDLTVSSNMKYRCVIREI